MNILPLQKKVNESLSKISLIIKDLPSSKDYTIDLQINRVNYRNLGGLVVKKKLELNDQNISHFSFNLSAHFSRVGNMPIVWDQLITKNIDMG